MVAALFAVLLAVTSTPPALSKQVAGGKAQAGSKPHKYSVQIAVPTPVIRSKVARQALKRPAALSPAERLALVREAQAALGQPQSAANVALPAGTVLTAGHPAASGVRLDYENVTLEYAGPDLPLPDVASIWAGHDGAWRGHLNFYVSTLQTPSLADCRFADDRASTGFEAHAGGKLAKGTLQYGHALFALPGPGFATLTLTTPSANFHYPVQFIDCTFTPL